jgi:hypothetical protein
MSQKPSVLCLAFGKVSSPEMALRIEGRALLEQDRSLGRQVALISAQTPALRLNSPGWMDVQPSLIAALGSPEQLRALCRDRLYAQIPTFAAQARRWIDRYLDTTEAVCGPADDSGGITSPGDRFFATLLPLPAARVALGRVEAGRLILEEDLGFCGFDLAFWDGTTLKAVLFGEDNVHTPRQKQLYASLGECLGNLFQLHRITNPTETTFIETLISQALTAPPPWFGPYRAEGFQSPLP